MDVIPQSSASVDESSPCHSDIEELAIAELQTPALLLDRDILERNLTHMRQRLARFGVPLRPHLKTAKSAAVWRRAVAGQPGGVTVQTIAEAEYFAAHGCTDIVYAVSIVPSKLTRLACLQEAGVKITIICDDIETAKGVQSQARTLGTSFPVMIEIDADGSRTGIRSDDPALLVLARQIASGPGTTLAGVLCHAGSAYGATSRSEIVCIAEQERLATVSAAERIRSAGLSCEVVSIGSSPSVAMGERFDDVTEVRAGVYMFQDLSLVELGLCKKSDIAATVLATVIAHNQSTGRIIIDAGALALSKDLGFAQRKTHHYGELVDGITGKPLHLVVNEMSQEHGIVEAKSAQFNDVPVGSLVRVLPNHVCITTAGFDHYHVIADGKIIDRWDRCTGW